MAEIILEPTAQSKVIPLSLRLNDTDTSLVSQLVTNRHFNTADTDAWFGFTLEGLAATTGTFNLTLINLQDKSVFNHTNKMFNTNPFYYNLDSGTDELTNEIRHAGKWVGQLVVTLPNGDSATRKFIFAIEGHILDGAVVQTILLEDYNALISDIESAKDELTQYNIDYSTLISTVESQEAARVQAELTREQTFNALVDSEIIAQSVATELQNVEARYAPRLLSTEQQLAEVASNVLYVESFRQTGETDDTATIQRAFTFIENTPGNRELKFASNKEYVISSPLVFNKHKYTTMTGAGAVIKVSDSVSELSPITHMIDCCYLGTGNMSGYLVCKDIEFNANNRALKTINGINPVDAFGYGLYYSKFLNTKFTGLRRDAWGIYGLSWAVSISDCLFLGYGEDPLNNAEHWRGKALFLANASNGVSVNGCNFARLERVAEGNADRVTFSENVFDYIKKAPFKVNGTSLSIKENYFEASGGEVEMVDVYGKVPEVIDAIIIFTNDSLDWTGIGRGLDVENNTFTDVRASNVLALNHVINVKFEENTFNFTEPFNSLAYLFGHGLQYAGRKNGYGLLTGFNNIEHWSTTYPNGRKLVNKIIDFSSLGNEINNGLEGIQIKDSLSFENKQHALPVNLFSGDFISHSAELPDWLITKQTISDEVVYKLELQSQSYINKINMNKYLKKSRGSYLRIKFSTVNTQSGAPIRLSIVDGVNNITYVPYGSLTDTNAEWTNYESLVFVDKNATELGFTIISYCSVGQSVYLKDFIISPAHYDCGMYEDNEA